MFRSFSLKFDPPSGMVSLGVEVDPVAGVADTGRFADDLAMLFEVLGETSRDLGIGTLILVDELEATPADLSAINTAVHQMGQSDIPLPIVFVGAGRRCRHSWLMPPATPSGSITIARSSCWMARAPQPP